MARISKEDQILNKLKRVENAVCSTSGGAADWELASVNLVDDVAGDGTGDLISYIELYAVYSDPADTITLIKNVTMKITRTSGSAGSGTVALMVRPPGGVFNAEKVFELQTGSSIQPSDFGFVVNPGSDIKFRVLNVSDNGTIVEGSFDYVLIDNP